MRLRVLSDLHADRHLDFEAWLHALPDGDQDVVVVPGDLCQSDTLGLYVGILADRWAPTPVIFVPGNHDYWFVERTFAGWGGCLRIGGRAYAVDALRKAQTDHSNLFVLQNEVLTLDGVLFVGGTGWHQGPPLSSDGYYIDAAYEFIRREEDACYHRLHEHAVRKPAVAITHHLPHDRSIHRQFRDYDNHAFYNPRLRSLVINGEYQAWLHGHTHCSSDYFVNGTQVVCNPLGYRDRESGLFENARFEACKIVEIVA